MRMLSLALAATSALTLSAAAAQAQTWLSINDRQDRLESRIEAGERYEPNKLNARLVELYRAHDLLLSRHALNHPKTQSNLRKLSLVSKLMTMDADYLARNLDRLANEQR